MDSNNNFWIDTYNRNVDKLIGVCYRYVYDKKIAEDLTHDSFLTAMNKFETYKGKGHFDAWLRKITVNTALQYVREIKNKQDNQQEILQQQLLSYEDKSNDKFDYSTKELIEAINMLPEHHRQVFNLYVLDGFSHKQIAEKLDISIGTSKSHLSRAKRRLQQILNKKEETKRSFIIILFPCGFGKIERLYKKAFKYFKLQPTNTTFSTTVNQIEEKRTCIRSKRSQTVTVSIVATMFVLFLAGIVTFISSKKSGGKNIVETKQKIDTAFDINSSISISETSNESINVNTPSKQRVTLFDEEKNTLKTGYQRADSITQPRPQQKQSINKQETDKLKSKDNTSKTINLSSSEKTAPPIVIKKKRIRVEKVVVRDTLTILDSANVN